MNFEILGLGLAHPEHAIRQTHAAIFAEKLCINESKKENSRALSALYRLAGVKTRHTVLVNETTTDSTPEIDFYPPAQDINDRGPSTECRMKLYEKHAPLLAIQAVSRALEEANISPSEVTDLVTVSCSGFDAPGFDIQMAQEIGLSPEISRTHIGFMGCHGALNGLRVAKSMTDANPNACVVVCAVELCSLHQFYGWDSEKMVANALFADGAAAIVGKRQEASSENWSIRASGSYMIPNSQEMMTWKVRNNGFEMTLSPEVPELIPKHLKPWLESWLQKQNTSLDQIASWAVHPGGPRILKATALAAGFDEALLTPSREILAQYGNMSSPTVLFILKKLKESHAPLPCVMLGYGPGLTIEAALVG